MNLQLYTVEAATLKKVITNRMDELGESHNPQEVSEYLTLQQILVNLAQQPETAIEDRWTL